MSTRHNDIIGTIGPRGFEPARSTRDAVRRNTPKKGTTDAATKTVAALKALGRRVDVIGSKFGKVADSFDGVADSMHRMADHRRALGFRDRA